jgi:sensor c-di-GMP phosphodiesterase-like protein
MTTQPEVTFDEVALALQNREFHLEYLPTIDLTTLKCVGCEALIRWKRGGVSISPAVFIPLIEKTPISGPLTYWVIEQFGKELGDWLRANPEAHLSFNVPPEILGRGGLDLAGEKCGLLDVVPQMIVEITERGVPDDIGLMALTEYVKLPNRCRIAMDDVGVGGVNLLVLARVPTDYIKLDKSIVDQLRSGAVNQKTLTEVLLLAQQSHGKIIAEGIEHADQLELLQELNIPYGQGWYFSKALPLDEFLAFHQKHRG